MNSRPIVSVIVPVFNGARYIRGAVESVFAQTFKNLEIIVVDDGSTDETKDLLGPWAREGKIRYIYQHNKGLAGARNTGIRHAKGKYLKFLDCDDLLYPEQLERQVGHLKDKPRTVVSATDYELEFESKNKVSVSLYLKEDQLAQFIGGNPCPVHTVLVDRKIVDEAGGFDEALLSHEDSDLWLRILIKGGTFQRMDYIGCCYRIHGGALSADANKMFRYYCKFSEKLNRALLPRLKELSQEALRQLYFRNFQSIQQCFSQDIKPASCLPVTLEVGRKLYAMKAPWPSKFLPVFTGFERVARKEYKKACLLDTNYPQKLLRSAWREEHLYDKKKFHYWQLEARNKRVKNVLYLNSSSVIYGAETRLLDIIKNLDRSKFHPFVLLPHPGPLDDKLKKLGVTTMHLEYGFPLDKINKENTIRFLRLNREFVKMVRQHDIDLIHANLHINMCNFWLGLLLLRLPVIVHMRSHFWISQFERCFISRTFKAICISRFVEREFLQKRRFNFLMDRRPGQTTILHDGIDINHFNPYSNRARIRKALNIHPDDFLVGIIGAVDKIKGQDLLIQAARIVNQKHPRAKYVIVGDLYHNAKCNTDYRDELLKMVEEFQLKDHVIFTGFRKNVRGFMSEVDLLVQPSKREALGTSMVEAMSCGKPVIGTDVDGIPDVIGENESGILLNPRTPEAFAEAINFFIENPEEARKRGARGRERALKLFNVYENIKRVEGIYDEALRDRW